MQKSQKHKDCHLHSPSLFLTLQFMTTAPPGLTSLYPGSSSQCCTAPTTPTAIKARHNIIMSLVGCILLVSQRGRHHLVIPPSSTNWWQGTSTHAGLRLTTGGVRTGRSVEPGPHHHTGEAQLVPQTGFWAKKPRSGGAGTSLTQPLQLQFEEGNQMLIGNHMSCSQRPRRPSIFMGFLQSRMHLGQVIWYIELCHVEMEQ